MTNAQVEPVRRALAQVSWLRASGEEVLSLLAEASRLQHLVDAAPVAWRGTQTSHLIVVASGKLELSMTSAEGKQHTASLLGRGQVFGLIPVLDGSTLIHDVCARGPSSIVTVPRDVILSTLHEQPALAMQMLLLLCERSRHNYEVLAERSLQPLGVRLARLLLESTTGLQLPRVQMTQADLADMLGASRQSINAELKTLERNGVIGISRGGVEIHDRSRLAAKTAQ